jgi:hypothetical protein
MNNKEKQKLVDLVVKFHGCKMVDNLSIANIIWLESATTKQLNEIVNTLREFDLVDDEHLKIEFNIHFNQSRIRFNDTTLTGK